MDSTSGISTALDTLTSVTGSVMNIIEQNQLLLTLFVASLMFIGIAIFGKIKKAAKR